MIAYDLGLVGLEQRSTKKDQKKFVQSIDR